MALLELEGARLWYEARGSGPVVVLLHAGIVDARMWDGLVETLAERFTALRYDQRGFGRSSPPQSAFSDVDDLRALLDELAVDRAALVGVSKGGSVAIGFALEHPARVWALVPVASGLPGFRPRVPPYSPEQEERYDLALDAGDLRSAAEVDLEIWAPLGSEGAIGELVHANARAAETEHLAEPLERPAAGRLEEIAVPTLVVTGDRDVPAMTEMGDRLEAGIAGARRVVVEGADHILPMRKPEDFRRVLLEFLIEAAPAG